ncbi:MAG: hemagglutinin repeat-containing protein [Gammaproteobacteria bacterium]
MSNRNPMRLPTIAIVVVHVVTMTPTAAFAETPAGAVAANTNTQVYVAPNGVPVVNIANPNAAGVSHNQYTQFNVDSRGLVLNNGDVSQVSRQSQLAGATLANLNLASQAKIILNEVVSPNRSVLAGFTEVLGGKADVIVANPFGITCSGCGFVNTDRVALTTGTPNFGTGGELNGFSVNGGGVLISGAGLNAAGQNYFDIVSRSLKVDGQINAHTLSVVTGTNDWDYESGSATPIAGASAASGYAFDSTALGGIYADRIRIIATEAGVGVRALGDVAATGDDFSIDSNGKIELKGAMSAQRDLSVRYYGDAIAGADGITFGAASASGTALPSLGAGHDLLLDAGNAGLSLFNGALTANNQLTVSALTLHDSSQSQSMRFGNQVTLLAQRDASIDGAVWGSAGILNGFVGSLSLGTGTRLYGEAVTLAAMQGDLDLGTASVQSPGDITLGSLGKVIVAGTAGNGVLAGRDLLLSSVALENSGDLLAGRTLGVGRSSVVNSGTLQAGEDATVAATDSFANQGKVLAGGVLTLSAGAAVNAGTLQAATDSFLSATSLQNSGKVLAGRDITVYAGDLVNDGTLQATRNVAMGSTNTLTNNADVLAGDTLTVTAADLTNAGTLQAVAGATISAGVLRNQGKVLAGTALMLNTPNVQNSGTLQSATDTTINGGSFDNQAAGNVVAGGKLVLASADVTNAGTLQAANDIALTAAHALSNGGKVLAGNTLTLQAPTLTNTGTLQAVNGAAITAGSLLNSGSAALIMTSTTGTGAGTLNIAGDLINEGAIHGNGALSITGGTLQNTGTGGISSLATLSLTSTSGGIDNAGALYGASQLNATATGQTFTNTLTGTVDAGNLLVNAGTFTNYNTVIVDGTATLNTTTAFNNLSGYSRAAVVGTAISYTTGPDYQGYVCHESNALNPCGGNDANYAEYDYWSATAGTQEYYLINPATLKKPQIIAGSVLNITIGAGTGHNQTGLLAAPIMNVSGTGTFTNEDLHLDAVDLKFDWTYRHAYSSSSHSYQWYIEGTPQIYLPGDPAASGNPYPTSSQYYYETGRHSLPVPANLGAGIFAGQLNFQNGLQVNNVGSTLPNTENLGSPASYLTASTPTSANSVGGASTVGGISVATGVSGATLAISLPTNPNGRFVTSVDPKSRYLIETNPLYGADGAFGSDYLARLLGYNVDTLEKRLGDANYEAKLVRDQLIAQTGRNILSGYASEKDQMLALMDAGAGQSTSLGLVFGKPLTSEQVSNLQHDLVWMVEQEVRGEKVLVPVVYLASSTRAEVESGAVIHATNINFNGQGLVNTGGTIRADDKLNATTTGDIVNRSGTITGGDVSLTSKNGSIRNETETRTIVGTDSTNTIIGKTGTISATRGLSLDASKDIVVKGGSLAAGGNADITAGRDVVLDTVQDTERDTTRSYSSSFGSHSSTKTTVETVNQIGSNVSAGGNVKIKSGNDVTLGGSNVTAGGDASIDAARDVNVVDRTDTRSVQTETESASISSDSDSVNLDHERTTNLKVTGTNVGSTVTAGGNAALNAGRTVTIKGSDVAAGGNIDVTGKDINVLAGADTTLDATHTEKESLGLGGHADANSVGWDLSRETTTSDKVDTTSTARTSTLKAGGNVTRKATGTLKDVGTQIDAGGDVIQSATVIDSRAAENTATSTISSHTEKVSVGPSIDYGVGNAIDDAKKGSSAGASAASGGPTVGNTAKYTNDDNSASSSSSQAVTSRIKAGGKISSSSKNDTTLEGTRLESGGDTDISAKNLNMKAAQDTTSSTASGTHIEAAVRGEIDASGKPGGKISGEYGTSESQSASSTAVVGTVKTGGSLNVRTSGDTRLEGTQVDSKGDTTIDAGGNVKLDAARDTARSSGSTFDAKGSVSAGKGSGGVSGSLDTSSQSSSSSQAVTGTVNTGGNLTVKSGKDVTLEGADLSAGKDAKISAGGKVDAKAAVSTSESQSESFSASVSASGSKGASPSAAAGGGGSSTSESTSTTTRKDSTIKAMGSVTVEQKAGAQPKN